MKQARRDRSHSRIAVALGLVVAATCAVAPAWAQTPPSGTQPSAEAAAAAARDAKELNRQGLAMVEAGDIQRALDFFLRSRAALPTTKNTTNAAVALDQLGRYDEALELYEELLLKYAGGLDDEDRAAVAPAMEALRKKVGSVYVTSNVAGSVVVDGRPRGKLPLTTPIRLLAGKHQFRIVRTGYVTFETSVDVSAGATLPMDARLEPQKGVGQLMVENVGSGDADVLVDGVRVGRTPWEGSLAPGRHLVWLKRDDKGSAPAAVQVLEGQVALTQLQTRPLGSPLTIRVEPRTASFEVAGVTLGPGSWRGQLPIGSYSISAAEAGYKSASQRVDLTAAGSPVELTIRLEVDPNHPRWPRATGHLWVEAHGGVPLGSSLGSDIEHGCPATCDGSPPVFGVIAGARGGYRFPFGGSVELGGGYMSLHQSLQRTETDTFGKAATTVRYELEDDLRVQGPYGSVGISLRKTLARRFHLGARMTFGVLVTNSSDPVTGTASTGGSSLPVFLEKGEESETWIAPFLFPQAFAGMAVGPLELGLSFAVGFFPANGKPLPRGRFGAKSTATSETDPPAVQNARESQVLDGERAHGRFVLFVPEITLGTTF